MSKETAELATLVSKRERYFQKLQVTYEMIKSLPTKEDVFLMRTEKCPEDLVVFNGIQDKLSYYKHAFNQEIAVTSVSLSYEELYFEVLANAKNILDKRALDMPPPREAPEKTHTGTLRATLPPIEIPKFKGDIEKFPAFKSLFDTLVHNSDLTDIQKFSFLKSYLEDPALNIIAGFDMTESNYALAYQKLVARYTDIRLVGNHYLKDLLHFKPIPDGSPYHLRNFLDGFCVKYEALRALNILNLSDFIIFTVALSILDSGNRRLFEEKYAHTNFPTFANLKSFVEDQYKVSSLMGSTVAKGAATAFPTSHSSRQSGGIRGSTKVFFSDAQGPKVNPKEYLTCPVCSLDHKLVACRKFLDMPQGERFEIVKSARLCFACLGPHARVVCQSKFACRECKSKSHHTLLHKENVAAIDKYRATNSSLPSNSLGPEASTSSLSCHVTATNQESSIGFGLLGTVLCKLRTHEGDWVTCRMVVDTASESSFITEALVQTLRLKRRRCDVTVVGVGSSEFVNTRGMTTCCISPFHNSDHELSFDAIILSRISSLLPKVPIDRKICERFEHLVLADPTFGQPGPIDILLGVQQYPNILSENFVRIPGEPSAISTIFGFLILGKVPGASATTCQSMFTSTSPLDELLTRFWEAEEVEVSNPPLIRDSDIDKFYRSTTVRDETGRYSVSLPFHDFQAPSNLGSTRDIALKRLYGVERRLTRCPQLAIEYTSVLQEYVSQDHMNLAPQPSDYIMTHHAVVRESTTTKVRVVFNGSERSDTGHSLNEFLQAGPKLQTDIGQILLSFRLNPVAFIGDVKQMFRQIGLNAKDRKYTHLFWRSSTTCRVAEWELSTLPFGLTCSPYLAQRTLIQLIEDEGSRFPLASQVLRSGLYVDDVVSSVDNAVMGIQLYKELSELFQSGGFSLRKIVSNDRTVLSHVPFDCQEGSIDFESSGGLKLLGLMWDPLTDAFHYRISEETPVFTKRGILSQAARIFDINGYITPILFWIKCFLQILWLSKVEWDEEISGDHKRLWAQFFVQIPIIGSIRIPRYFGLSSARQFTIIGFSDASEKGFAACLYLRIESESGDVVVNLMKAKSRVAPLKHVTIPRLELNGAVLLAKVFQSCSEFLDRLPNYDVICYTDSTTVLSWLRTSSHRLKSYVANRVVTVVDSLPSSLWRHVPGVNNPADLGSRGTFPEQLFGNSLWWRGPDFLCSPISVWPNSPVDVVDPLPESKDTSVSFLVANRESVGNGLFDELMSKYSYQSLRNVVAYVVRFIQNCRLGKSRIVERKTGPLFSSEVSNAKVFLCKYFQQEYYSDQINILRSGRSIGGPLRSLSLFLDSDGLLRVGGRLARAPLTFSSKHPILLHRRSQLARLICVHYHVYSLHGGQGLVQSLIQRSFWIPGCRYLLRSVIFTCFRCYRFKVKPLEPRMSDLPSLRFHEGRAFVNVGVDLAGPYMLKESKRRNSRSHKCWMVLFICLSTRAVYLDVVVDLSTAAFFNTLDRFIARRGIPARICSDMGTNFVGAARGIREIHQLLEEKSAEIRHYCSLRKVIWQFNPPAAPNFGGSWEAAVKSAKYHLNRVLNGQPLVFDEFSTLLARVEAVLNSRPLCPLSSDPSDGFDYLTPGHFLVGAPLILSRPEIDITKEKSLHHRWHLITRAVQDFWIRWSKEYLHTLIQRSKWTKETTNLEVGRLVLIADDNLPPTAWSLGRVQECMPGSDGVVRVVRLKTSSGERCRPVNKLCLLPFDTSS